MQKLVNSSRIYVLFAIVSVLFIIYSARIYGLQMRGGADVDEVLANATTTRETVEAARGDIVDRNGMLLVSTNVSYNVSLSRDMLLELENRNDIIRDVAYLAVENGIDYTDTFPITKAAPFAYVAEMSGEQKSRLAAYFEFFDLDPEISASDLIVWMKKHYGISYTTSLTDARIMIGIRYELEIRAIVLYVDPYVFAKDVGTEFVAILEEKNFPGVSVLKSAKREYCTPYAAHILGYLGKITAEQVDKYKALDYPMDAVVGQSGVEAAYEEYLHGVDGLQKVTRSESGAVISTETLKKAQPGDNVYLSIDIGVQAAAEEALADTIAAINVTREEGDYVTGGAAVVLGVGTGETIAMASYPTFDLSTFLENYSSLISDPANPVYNRATMGTYSPGSTFKMAVALAGLRSGTIDRWTTVNDTGKYMAYAYAHYTPVCWLYSNVGYGHGALDLVGALQHSCNVFFYWVGDHTGIRAITAAAEDFGFGKPTGVEIDEWPGIVSSVEYKEETFNEDWYAADTLLSAIGQGYNLFTPIQLANYTATIASGGTRYTPTLLNSVKSADYSDVVFETAPKITYQFAGADIDYISILQEGMTAVADPGGTAASVFADFEVDVAAKTGTVQSDADVSNNGVFVCYAPANDPEIAVAIVVEKGGSGSAIMGIAKEILSAYFGGDAEVSVVTDNTLLR